MQRHVISIYTSADEIYDTIMGVWLRSHYLVISFAQSRDDRMGYVQNH